MRREEIIEKFRYWKQNFRKRHAVAAILILLGGYALAQSVISFGKTDKIPTDDPLNVPIVEKQIDTADQQLVYPGSRNSQLDAY